MGASDVGLGMPGRDTLQKYYLHMVSNIKSC